MRKYIDWGIGLLVFSREAVYDGFREIKEEIGIDVSFDELVPRRFHQQRTGKRLSI